MNCILQKSGATNLLLPAVYIPGNVLLVLPASSGFTLRRGGINMQETSASNVERSSNEAGSFSAKCSSNRVLYAVEKSWRCACRSLFLGL